MLMSEPMTAGQKAARTRKRRAAAAKAVDKRRRMSAFAKAHAAEAASKDAFLTYCQQHGWRVAFFEGATGAPRTGIIDAIAFRPVSYTHLRAHETDSYLVCRL